MDDESTTPTASSLANVPPGEYLSTYRQESPSSTLLGSLASSAQLITPITSTSAYHPSVPRPIAKVTRSPELEANRFVNTSPSAPRVRISTAPMLPRPSPLSRLNPTPQSLHTGASSQSISVHRHTTHHQPHGQARAPHVGENYEVSPKSPCFIHSHLEKHGQLSEWLRAKAEATAGNQNSMYMGIDPEHHTADSGTNASTNGSAQLESRVDLEQQPKVVPSQPVSIGQNRPESSFGNSLVPSGDLSDTEDGGSLTRQLAETASGVREMSKQLGRTKVRSNIQHVLIVTKARDNRLIQLTRELAIYLMTKKRPSPADIKTGGGSSVSSRTTASRGMVVYVDSQLRRSKRFDAAGIQSTYPELFAPYPRRRSSSSASVNTMSGFASDASGGNGSRSSLKGTRRSDEREEGQLRYWTSVMCSNTPHLFDFVITLGGDGTVLFTSWLFQRIVPPVLPFALGSLGFLTNFDFANYAKTIDNVVDDGIRVNLRMRFTCTVYRAVSPEENSKKSKRKAWKSAGGEILMGQVDKAGWEALEGAHGPKTPTDEVGEAVMCGRKKKKDKEIMCFSTRPVETFEVLNDLVVDRGPSPYVSLLEIFGDDNHLTTVQADGLCVATPTGSTAYSLSAGGSLVHPGIPAILISPICPHTLSFRPMLLPDGMELRICVPYDSRSTAWASFDGRGRVELKQGDHIKVTASKFPFPTVCADKQSTDWFHSISRTLRWNEREKQKSFVVVEEEQDKPPVVGKSTTRRKVERRFSNTEAGEGISRRRSQAEEAKADSSSEDEEDEEDTFDIDEASDIGTSSSSPQQSPPEPVTQSSQQDTGATIPMDGRLRIRRLTLEQPVDQESGVNTPGRFAQGYNSPKPLSPRHFTDVIDRRLQEAVGDQHARRKSSSSGGGVGGGGGGGGHQAAVEGSRRQSRAVEAGERDMIDELSAEAYQTAGNQIPLGRDDVTGGGGVVGDVGNSVSPTTRTGLPDQEERERGGGHRKTKAFAFYGQDESDSGMSDENGE